MAAVLRAMPTLYFRFLGLVAEVSSVRLDTKGVLAVMPVVKPPACTT